MEIIFTEQLRTLMQEKNLTQKQLAEKTGIPQNTISAWLTEKRQPGIFYAWVLADYFGVDVDFLIGRKDY